MRFELAPRQQCLPSFQTCRGSGRGWHGKLLEQLGSKLWYFWVCLELLRVSHYLSRTGSRKKRNWRRLWSWLGSVDQGRRGDEVLVFRPKGFQRKRNFQNMMIRTSCECDRRKYTRGLEGYTLFQSAPVASSMPNPLCRTPMHFRAKNTQQRKYKVAPASLNTLSFPHRRSEQRYQRA